MSGGIAWLTLPAGYLGSGLIGAALIACGFDTNASKVASIVLACSSSLRFGGRDGTSCAYLPPPLGSFFFC